MSNLLIDIFSAISQEEIMAIGEKASISKKRVDQVSFDTGELIISSLAKNSKNKDQSESFVAKFNNNKQEKSSQLFFESDTKKVIKRIAQKNNEEEERVAEFIEALGDLIYYSLKNIFSTTNMNGEVFSNIAKMSAEKQKEESIKSNGILSVLDLNKDGFIRDDMFNFLYNYLKTALNKLAFFKKKHIIKK